MAPAKAREDGDQQVTDATADAAAATVVASGDDFELVYVCNPKVHKDADPKPSPGRVTRAWLALHADKGWVECDASGEPVKGS